MIKVPGRKLVVSGPAESSTTTISARIHPSPFGRQSDVRRFTAGRHKQNLPFSGQINEKCGLQNHNRKKKELKHEEEQGVQKYFTHIFHGHGRYGPTVMSRTACTAMTCSYGFVVLSLSPRTTLLNHTPKRFEGYSNR